MKGLKRLLRENWPFLGIFLLVILFFRKFIFEKLLPIPADIIVGLYFPYLDYKWGTITGVPVRNPLLSDIPSLLYPWRSLVIDQLKQLKLPLWNSHYFLGMPLLAIFQSAVFSPANLFFIFFRKPLAWSLGIIFQPVLAMSFFYLWLKEKKLTKFACLFGAVAFAFSGFSLAWMEFNVHGWTAAFLPLHLLLLDKILNEKKKIYGYLLSLSFALQVFSGYLPIVIYSGIIVGVYFLFNFDWHHLRRDFIIIKILAAAVLLAIFLAAVQLLPGFELTKLSIRDVDPIARDSSGGFFPVANFITFLAPDFFGNPATYNFWGKPYYDNFFGFIGLPAVLLVVAVLGLNFRKRRETSIFSLLLLVSLVMITRNPVSLFLERINFLSLKGGIWARALFITDFSLAVLAAHGFEDFTKNKIRLRKTIFILLATIACFLFLWLLALGKLSMNFIDREYLLVAKRNLILPTGAVLAISVLFAIKLIFRTNFKVGLITITGFFLIEVFSLFYQANKYLPFSKESYLFPKTPVINFLILQSDPFRIEPGQVLPQNFWMFYGLEAVSGYDALMPLRAGKFLTAVETGKASSQPSRVQLLSSFNSPLFKLLNVRFFLAKKQDENGRFVPTGKYPDVFSDKQRFKLVFEDKTVGVFEDLAYLPRAWLVNDYQIEKNEDKTIEILKGGKFDFLKKVVLEEEPIGLGGEENSLVTKDSLDFGMTEEGRRSYLVRSKKGTILFESAAYYPGWRAFIDGQPVKLLRANHVFRALVVPPGIHEVRLYFEPRSVAFGMIFSFLSFVYLVYRLTKWKSFQS